MSEYGRPAPQGAHDQYVPSGFESQYRQEPPAPRTAADPNQLITIMSLVAGGLGVLGFIWGFLPWLTSGIDSAKGYQTSGGAAAAVGLTLAAGLIAAGVAFEKRDTTLLPVGLAAAALLVSVGQIIEPGAGINASIGLILMLVTTVLQTGALAYGWLLASGRMAAPSSTPKASPNQWTGDQPGYGASQQSYGASQQSYGASQQSYGAPQQNYSAPQQNYSAPQQNYSAPQQGVAAPQADQYTPPAPGQFPAPQPFPSESYGPPPGGYPPPPAGPGSTASLPVQDANPYEPGEPAPSESAPPAGDDGYGETTRHIPRYTGPGANPRPTEERPEN